MADTAGLTRLSDLVTQAEQEQYDLPRMLNEALVEKYKNSPLRLQAQEALAGAYSAPERAFEQYAQPQTVTIGGGQAVAPGQNPVGEQETVPNVYLRPSTQRRLVSEQAGTAIAKAGSLNDLLALQYGAGRNLIDSLTQMLEARTKGAKQRYEHGINLEKLQIEAQKAGQAQQKQTQKYTDIINDSDLTLRAIQKARDEIAKGGTGAEALSLFGLREMLPEKFGGLSQQVGTTRSAIAEVNKYWFRLAGKAVTGPERELLKVPSETQRSDLILQRLNALEDTVNQIRAQAAGNTFVPPEEGATPAPFDNFDPTEWEVIQ